MKLKLMVDRYGLKMIIVILLVLTFFLCAFDIWFNLEKDPDGSWNLPIFTIVVLSISILIILQQLGVFKIFKLIKKLL